MIPSATHLTTKHCSTQSSAHMTTHPYKGDATSTNRCDGIEIFFWHLLAMPAEREESEEGLYICLVAKSSLAVSSEPSPNTAGNCWHSPDHWQMSADGRCSHAPGYLGLHAMHDAFKSMGNIFTYKNIRMQILRKYCAVIHVCLCHHAH